MLEINPELLAATSISKRFGATQALVDASISLKAGEVHALVGENGAGKSTLVKILVGAEQADSGTIAMSGKPVTFSGVGAAVAQGVIPIYQQLSLMPHLSVTENLFAFELASPPGWRGCSREWHDRAEQAMEVVGLNIDVSHPVDELSLAQRQLVEIARSVVVDCKVLVLDEPTTALTAGEIEQLFAVVRELRARGRSVLFISHRLGEVMEISDRISVLRNGRCEMEGMPIGKVSAEQIIRAMVGRDVASTRVFGHDQGAPILEASGLSAPGLFRNLSLTVHRGEVLALVGLIGSGALELAETLAGNRSASGSLLVNGHSLRLGNRHQALVAGVGYVPADRDLDGNFPTLRVRENGTACSLDLVSKRGIITRDRERRHLLPLLRALAIKPDNPEALIASLSGGNQQKVLLARTLSRTDAQVVVAIEPSRGVDIGARRDILETLRHDANRGAAVVIASTDLDEVVSLADRIIVMRSGQIVAELPGTARTTEVLASMIGTTA